MYARIYSDAVIDLMEIPVVYTSSVMPYSIPEKVERNAFINSLPKSVDSSKVPSADADGNIDFKDAVDKIGLKFESLRSACDIFDLTHKGYEQLMSNQDMSVNLIIGAVQVTPFSDKVLYADNDNNGIPNKDDPYLDEPFDDRFEIVNNFDYVPKVDFVEERYKRSQECYGGTTIPRSNEIEKKIPSAYGSNILGLMASFASMDNKCSFADEIISDALGKKYNVDFYNHKERKNNSKSLDHAADALLHYFECSGEPVIYLENDICELISSSLNNLDHLHRNITRIMKCAESTIADNGTIILSAKSNSNIKATCFDSKGAEDGGVACGINTDPKSVSHHNSELIHCNYVHRDWQNTFGESFGSIVAEINRSGNKYTMNYKYYVIDLYEWAFHSDKNPLSYIFHMYHEKGLSQEYIIQGGFEGTVTWSAGETAFYPNIINQIKKH